jgi:NAD(P)H-dependent FMN reductase
LRQGSYTEQALRIALTGAEEVGAETDLIDLRRLELIFCDGKDDESGYPQGVFELRERVASAQGLVLGTPEYHGGFSGVLKNAIDLMGSDELSGKIVGLVGVSGGKMDASGSFTGLRLVCRSVHAQVIPHQAAIPQAWKEFDDSGELTDRSLANRVKDVGRQVARAAFVHTSREIEQILNRWDSSVDSEDLDTS